MGPRVTSPSIAAGVHGDTPVSGFTPSATFDAKARSKERDTRAHGGGGGTLLVAAAHV